MQGLLTVKQAAEVIGVSVDTMRQLVYSGQISYVDINMGGTYIKARFTRQHLEDFMRKCEVKAG